MPEKYSILVFPSGLNPGMLVDDEGVLKGRLKEINDAASHLKQEVMLITARLRMMKRPPEEYIVGGPDTILGSDEE